MADGLGAEQSTTFKSKLIYVKKGAQREANHSDRSRLLGCYPQAKKAVTPWCRGGEPVAKKH